MIPYFDDFLLSLHSNNYSKQTIYNYDRDLQVFSQFLDECGINLDSVDKKAIAQYKAYLTSQDRKTAVTAQNAPQKLAPRSINRMLSSLRSYMKYLIEMDLPYPVAPDAIKMIRSERKHPRVAELFELEKLITAPSHFEKDLKIALRNRAMLEVLFATGMRISELCNLNREQIDGSGRIFITGKGRKQRFTYLTQRAIKCVEDYLRTRSDSFPALFIPYRGRNASNRTKRVSTNYLQDRIVTYRQMLRINVPTSAHSLRHGFATYLAEEGASPAAIQILLGHESLATTTRYVHASDRYAEETHRKFHPLSKVE
ncbi:tyrosine-type recombinase/integrase [Chloroflexota bacterium]